MRIGSEYDHLQAGRVISQIAEVRQEILVAFEDRFLLLGRERPRQIKVHVAYVLNSFGWADRVRIKPGSNLTVNFLKNRTALCFQLGNVARVYADLLKLALLHQRNRIDVGVIAVPAYLESKMLGANYAHFDRLTSELHSFQEIISVPIWVIGLTN